MQIGILTRPESLLPVSIFNNDQVEPVLVQKPEGLVLVDGLVLAGNNIALLEETLKKNGLVEPIKEKIKEGMPVLGLGAGLFLMAKFPADNSSTSLGVMDIIAVREGFQRKFCVPLYIQAFGLEPLNCIFDHAPYISWVAPHIGIMAFYQGKIVMARQGNFLVSAFFTEGEEKRVENYFLEMIRETQI